MSQVERARPSSSRADHRDADQPRRGRRLHGAPRLRGRSADQVRRNRGPADDAFEAVRRHALVVDTLHFHAGSGWLGDQLDGFEAALARATTFLDRLLDAGFPIREVNVGGGLGRAARDGRATVDLDAYAAVVARHLGPYGVTVAFEPGDLVMKDAAVLLAEVVTVERRGDTTSSAWTSGGTSTARTSSTSTRRRSSRSRRRSGLERSR